MAISLEIEQTVVFPVGELTRDNVMTIKKSQYQQLLSSDMQLDMTKTSKVDTAGLAWLFLVKEQAAKSGGNVKVINAPDDLHKLAKLSGVAAMLAE